MTILCPAIGIGYSDTGKYPGFVNIQSTAVFAENFKSHLNPPNVYWRGSAGTGLPAKSSRFGKERRIQIGNESVIHILAEYKDNFSAGKKSCNNFFVNQSGKALSDQSVRRMINKYTTLASIEQHITPHMFRHTFATSLLEADVDIRYIQEMLGHSSINITEIYTHVTVAKQRNILATKHPRKDFHI